MGPYVGDPQTLKPADHWQENEVDMLRGDLDDAQELQYEAEQIADTALDAAEKYRNKYEAIKQNIEDKVDEMNGKLREKSMIYLDLIAEYETVLNTYAEHSPIKLTTSKIHQLRKRGGLSV